MLWIFDEQLRRIKILKQYEMAQWSNKFREIGTFSINARYVQENLYLLDKTKTYYILLYSSNDETQTDDWNAKHNVFGKIEKVSKEDEQDADFASTIKIEGRLIPLLLTKRVTNGTIDSKDTELMTYMQNLIINCFPSATERYISLQHRIVKDESIYTDVPITKQVTGGQLWDNISDYLEQYKLGIRVAPYVVKTHSIATKYNYMSGLTNISDFIVSIETGQNRTRGHGTDTVIFSKSLSNIKRASYSFNAESDMNVAYVAGEGEGDERKWYELQKDDNNKKSAWNREELWVDARDIQSGEDDEETGETKLTEEEYAALIKQRAVEKFEENTLSDEYTATVNEYNTRYVYMRDYDLGDWVTVQDKDLGIEIDAQIVEVTTTLQNNQMINDISFEYGTVKRIKASDIRKLTSKVEAVSGSVESLNKKIGSGTQIGEVESKIKTIEGNVKNLSENVGTIEGDVGNLDKKVDGIDTRVTTVESKITDPLTLSDIFDMFYPVGTIIETVDKNFDPAQKWGGTWTRIKGRVLVGVDEDDAYFDTPEKTGGYKKPNIKVENLPSHSHSVAVSVSIDETKLEGGMNNIAGQDASWGLTAQGSGIVTNKGDVNGFYPNAKTNTTSYQDGFWINATHSHTASTTVSCASTGGGQGFEILQPYTTCYIWKRTA